MRPPVRDASGATAAVVAGLDPALDPPHGLAEVDFLALSKDGWDAVVGYVLLLSGVLDRSGRPVVLFSGGDPAQFEESANRWRVGEIHYLVLTCRLSLQEQRLRSRPAWRNSQA